MSIDLTGTLPTPEEVKAFLADKDDNRRDKLIDRLLEKPEYSYYFANRWADVLKVRRAKNQARAFGTFAFHAWIREAIAADKPYDEFAREILAAIGDETKVPPLPCDCDPASGHALPDLPPDGRMPAREPQRGPDRALPPGPSRSARHPFAVVGRAGGPPRMAPPFTRRRCMSSAWLVGARWVVGGERGSVRQLGRC